MVLTRTIVRTNLVKTKTYNCPVEASIDVIGGKWKTLILWWLHQYLSLCGIAPAHSRNYEKDAPTTGLRVGGRWHRCAARLCHRSAKSGILADGIWPLARARA